MVIKKVKDLGKYLEEFEEKIENFSFSSFKEEELYDLDRDWPDRSWPKNRKKGVYLFLDKSKKVIYVGKTGMGSQFGARLQHYFQYNKNGTVKKLGKAKDARYIYAIDIDSEFNFLIPALEEYLISRYQPRNNDLGKKRKKN